MSRTGAATDSLVLRRGCLSSITPSVISTLMIMLGVLNLAGHNNSHVQLCSEIHSRCFGRDGCKFALETYFLHCMDLSTAPSSQCTEWCKMALIMLLSSEEHEGANAFKECDCQEEQFCLQQKEHITVCQEDVQRGIDAIQDPTAPISCSLATLVCSADSMCLTAIDYYEDHCKRLQNTNKPRCNSRCNNSLNILYRLEKAQKLQTCYCDGTELYNCTLLKKNTQELCFKPRVRHPGSHGHVRWPHAPHPNTSLTEVSSVSDKKPMEQDFLKSSHNSAYNVHYISGVSRWLGCKFAINVLGVMLLLLYMVCA